MHSKSKLKHDMAIRKSLSAKTDSKGYSQVMLLVEKGRNGRFRLKSGIFVPKEYWNENKNDLVIPRKINKSILNELYAIRNSLDILCKNIDSLIRIYQERADKKFIEKVLPFMDDISGAVTAESMAKVLEKIQKAEDANGNTTNVFDIVEEYIIKKVSSAKIRHFRTVLRTMIRYQHFVNTIYKRNFAWDTETTTAEDVKDYFDYLQNEHLLYKKHETVFSSVSYNEPNKLKKKERVITERGNNRLVTIKKQVQTFWKWMIKQRITKNNPFEDVEIGSEKYGVPYYLTIEERKLIANSNFPKRPALEIQRDIFVFQCLVGCRVGDLYSFTQDNIVDNVLTYMPHKTKDESSAFIARVPLNEEAQKLIKRYKGKDEKGRLFPFISEQNYNYAIKDILTLCDIKRKVSVRNTITGETELQPINEIASSHMARRTFVGNAYHAVKDPNLIGKMSGHVEGSKAFNRYRTIEDDLLKEVVDLIS